MGLPELFGPLGHKISEQGENLNRHFCEVKEVLRHIANNTYAIQLLNQRQMRSIVASAEGEGILSNDTGYGWLVHWVANSGKTEPEVFLGGSSPERFLIKMGKKESSEVDWYIPPNVKLIATGLTGSVNVQVEMVPVGARHADTGESNEHYELNRHRDEIPTADIFQEVPQ